MSPYNAFSPTNQKAKTLINQSQFAGKLYKIEQVVRAYHLYGLNSNSLYFYIYIYEVY